MSFNLSRRGFLMGVGAVALLPPSRLFAQTAPVGMTVAADGSLVFASNTAVRSAVLSELATGIARSAPTRAAATVAFRGAAARFMAGMAMRTPIGIAGLASVGDRKSHSLESSH